MTDFTPRLFVLLALMLLSGIACSSADEYHPQDGDVADPASPPAQIDHLILAINDLQAGIDTMEERTGVRAVAGGRHPHLGTHNALIARFALPAGRRHAQLGDDGTDLSRHSGRTVLHRVGCDHGASFGHVAGRLLARCARPDGARSETAESIARHYSPRCHGETK